MRSQAWTTGSEAKMQTIAYLASIWKMIVWEHILYLNECVFHEKISGQNCWRYFSPWWICYQESPSKNAIKKCLSLPGQRRLQQSVCLLLVPPADADAPDLHQHDLPLGLAQIQVWALSTNTCKSFSLKHSVQHQGNNWCTDQPA